LREQRLKISSSQIVVAALDQAKGLIFLRTEQANGNELRDPPGPNRQPFRKLVVVSGNATDPLWARFPLAPKIRAVEIMILRRGVGLFFLA
jgi:hypothetical protein